MTYRVEFRGVTVHADTVGEAAFLARELAGIHLTPDRAEPLSPAKVRQAKASPGPAKVAQKPAKNGKTARAEGPRPVAAPAPKGPGRTARCHSCQLTFKAAAVGPLPRECPACRNTAFDEDKPIGAQK